ncbi:hypothetical protein PVAND_001668 [Polypedilum vanderplanki]|uniref:Uncharacterized protein n=1 Tax=Polypedilum vanderplanki TaxID=319348 RepID=A0A9J6BNL6_POLVA|nr:hypothetical protein PVAND_001668 [Polypedilum vanderplanki]
MTNIGIQRKRSRSIENENEFFPLSKRINNLDIKFSQITIINNNVQQIIPQNHQQQPMNHHYNPELSREENPHYYYKNNILYDLYIERLRRNENKTHP